KGKQALKAAGLHYISALTDPQIRRLLGAGTLQMGLFSEKESRTRGHVFCCMLALKIIWEMERRLQARFGTTDSDPHTTTLPDALAALSRLCLLEYQIDEKNTVTRLPKPDARQKEILTALAIQLPDK
ncbi:MAG: hypothetical protein AAB225_09430, partial [Acidobacteriota bacterium]